ncbi:hypothetical protein ACOSQ4_011420 [Xanthoceras sorbifolium]
MRDQAIEECVTPKLDYLKLQKVNEPPISGVLKTKLSNSLLNSVSDFETESPPSSQTRQPGRESRYAESESQFDLMHF